MIRIWLKAYLPRMFRATEEANRRAILDGLPQRPGCRVLDIGCHRGDLTLRVAARVGTTHVAGLELMPEHVEVARRRGIDAVRGDVDEGLPFPDASFDVIHANQVIEHVRRTDRFLSEVRRVLAPGGVVAISTNNLASWHNVASLALGLQPMPMHVSDEVIVGNPLNPEQGDHHEDLGRSHLRLFTARALSELAVYHGLEVQDFRTVGYYPLPPSLARIANRIDGRHSAFLVAFCHPSTSAQREVAAREPDAIAIPGVTPTLHAAAQQRTLPTHHLDATIRAERRGLRRWRFERRV